MDLDEEARKEFITPKAYEQFMKIWNAREAKKAREDAQPQPPPQTQFSGPAALQGESSQGEAPLPPSGSVDLGSIHQFLQSQFQQLHQSQTLFQQQIQQQQFIELQRLRHDLRSRMDEIADHFGRRIYRLEDNMQSLISDHRAEYEERMSAAGQEPREDLFQYQDHSHLFQTPVYSSAGPPGFGYLPPAATESQGQQFSDRQFEFTQPSEFDPEQILRSWRPTPPVQPAQPAPSAPATSIPPPSPVVPVIPAEPSSVSEDPAIAPDV